MKEEILRLRAEGYSYRKIQQELGCSKSTIAYHCSEGQKEKLLERNHRYRRTIPNILYRKLAFFIKESNVDLEKFRELIPKFIENPYCYLTGDIIDLTKSDTFQLDHIIPKSKGGSNSPDNIGLATKNTNQSKSDMSIEEYFVQCEKVLRYNRPELFTS